MGDDLGADLPTALTREPRSGSTLTGARGVGGREPPEKKLQIRAWLSYFSTPIVRGFRHAPRPTTPGGSELAMPRRAVLGVATCPRVRESDGRHASARRVWSR